MVQTLWKSLQALFSPFWVVLSFLVLAPIAILHSCVTGSGNGAHRVGRLWARFSLWAAGVRVEIKGEGHLCHEGGVIFACNHASQFDILALYAALPVQFRFVAKKELFGIPLLGQAMRATGYVSIDRSGGRAAVRSLQAAAQRVREGTSILVFAEGTRSPDGHLRPFKVGGFMLAIKAGCPVVPVAISGSHRVLPKGSMRVRNGRIRVVIGQPIPSVESGRPLAKEVLAEEVWKAVIRQLAPENRPSDTP